MGFHARKKNDSNQPNITMKKKKRERTAF